MSANLSWIKSKESYSVNMGYKTAVAKLQSNLKKEVFSSLQPQSTKNRKSQHALKSPHISHNVTGRTSTKDGRYTGLALVQGPRV